mgnify:CR=1 FL=1
MSVRCSYCGGEGHNRISCEARKRAVECHKQEIASGTRPWSSLIDEQEIYDRRKTKPRKCSYCANRHYEYNYDHNRRNCPRLAEDKAKLVSDNKEWRSAALELMKEHGIGVGAIFNDRYYGRCLITEVRWGSISCLTQTWCNQDRVNFRFTTLESLSRGQEHTRWKEFPRFENGMRWSRWGSSSIDDFNMVVPATPRFIQADVPDGWSSGETDLDTYFLASNDKKC